MGSQIPFRDPIVVVGSADFHTAFTSRFLPEDFVEAQFVTPEEFVADAACGQDAILFVDSEQFDRGLSERLLQAVKTATEIRILSASSLRTAPCESVTAAFRSDSERVTGIDVGKRVSEKVRARLGSIRLGSEILLNKVRNPNADLKSDVESLHSEIIDYCESHWFYIDLRVPRGLITGTWTEFDAVNELRSALLTAVAHSDCQVHLAGVPYLKVGGIKRDLGRLVHEAVKNAIQHGFAKNVWMKVESDSATGEALLTIEDDGQGLSSNSACENSFDSNGIGILICRRILSRYDGKLELVVKKTDGIRFVARWNPKLRRPATVAILSPFELSVEP